MAKRFRALTEEINQISEKNRLNEVGVPFEIDLWHNDENNEDNREAQVAFAKRHVTDLMLHPVATRAQFKGTNEPTAQQTSNYDPVDNSLEDEGDEVTEAAQSGYKAAMRPSTVKQDKMKSVKVGDFVRMRPTQDSAMQNGKVTRVMQNGDFEVQTDDDATHLVPSSAIQTPQTYESVTEETNNYQNYVVEFDVPGSSTGTSGQVTVRARNQNEAVRKAKKSCVNEGKFSENTYVTVKSVGTTDELSEAKQTSDKDRINQRQAGDENVKKFINKQLKAMGADSLDDLSDEQTKRLFNKVEYEFSSDSEKPDPNSKRDKPEKKNEELEEATITEENVMNTIKTIAEKGRPMNVKFDNGKSLKVDEETANMLTKLHDSLKPSNRDKFETNLSKGPNSFMKMVDFAYENL